MHGNTRRRRARRWGLALPGVVIASALLLAACGDTGGDAATEASTQAPSSHAPSSHAPSTVAESGLAYEPPVAAQPFTLTGMDGEAVSLADFRGQVVAIYFGYTHCPDMCPLTLGTYKAALSRLPEGRDEDVQVLMLTVDPARDTPEVLGRYMALFRDDFIGLTGSQADVDAVLASWGIEVLRTEPNEFGAYEVEHPVDSWVLDRDGRLRLKVSHMTGIDALVADLQSLLEEGN